MSGPRACSLCSGSLYWRNRQQDSTKVPCPCLGSCLHAEALSLGPHLSCIADMPVPAHLLHWSRSWPWPTHWTFHLDRRLVCHSCLTGAHWTSAYPVHCLQTWSSSWLADMTSGVILDLPHCCALVHSDCHVDVAIWTLGWTWSLAFPQGAACPRCTLTNRQQLSCLKVIAHFASFF